MIAAINELIAEQNSRRWGSWRRTSADEPFWLTFGADGKWVYSSTGDIIDATSKKVIASLKDELGRDVQGEKAVEVVYQAGKLSKTVDQFGVGRVLPGATSGK